MGMLYYKQMVKAPILAKYGGRRTGKRIRRRTGKRIRRRTRRSTGKIYRGGKQVLVTAYGSTETDANNKLQENITAMVTRNAATVYNS